jgi:hypothetical protein
MRTGGFLRSNASLQFHLAADYTYDLVGNYAISGGAGQIETGFLNVHIKDLDTDAIVFENNQSVTSNNINLDVSGGSPTGSLTGILPAGNYELFVSAQAEGGTPNGSFGGAVYNGAGSVTLDLQPAPVTALLSMFADPNNFVQQSARSYFWGHTPTQTISPLPFPGNQSATASQGQNVQQNPNVGTVTYTGTQPGEMTLDIAHTMRTGGFLRSTASVRFNLAADYIYDLIGNYAISGGAGRVETGFINVHIKHLDTDTIVFENNQSVTSNNINLDVSGGSPTGSLTGVLPAGNLELFVSAQVEGGTVSAFAGAVYNGAGSVTLELTPGTLTLLSPVGGENIPPAVAVPTFPIQWSPSGAGDILIEYSDDAGATWNPVATVPNTGSYDWPVPAPTDQGRIRISDPDSPYSCDSNEVLLNLYACTGPADINGDCFVDLVDAAILFTNWLTCSDPFNIVCTP